MLNAEKKAELWDKHESVDPVHSWQSPCIYYNGYLQAIDEYDAWLRGEIIDHINHKWHDRFTLEDMGIIDKAIKIIRTAGKEKV